jgi:hypothetical protein
MSTKKYSFIGDIIKDDGNSIKTFTSKKQQHRKEAERLDDTQYVDKNVNKLLASGSANDKIKKYIDSEFKCLSCNGKFKRSDCIGQLECTYHCDAKDKRSNRWLCCNGESKSTGCKKCDHHDKFGFIHNYIGIPLNLINTSFKKSLVQENVIGTMKFKSNGILDINKSHVYLKTTECIQDHEIEYIKKLCGTK